MRRDCSGGLRDVRKGKIQWTILRAFMTEQRGSMTVEATLTFPVILLIVLVLLFAMLFYYERVHALKQANAAASVAAEQWNYGAGRGHASSEYPNTMHQGLYWRWTEGGIASWFKFKSSADDYALALPIHESGIKSQPIAKLAAAGADIPQYFEGHIGYKGHLFFPRINVQLASTFQFPFLLNPGQRKIDEAAMALITDPVEWIRNVDLVRSYSASLQNRSISKEQAQQSIIDFLNLQRPETFDSHNPAAEYLRKLVSGQEKKFDLDSGSYRLIDAFTENGIAHQAYLTFTESQIRTQMEKDVELLNKGTEVNGVVWHFFRRTNQKGRVGPSPQLLQDLKANGIIVVIHE